MRSFLLAVCLLFAATVSVEGKDAECECLTVATGSWDISFGEEDTVPFSKEGRMELQHDFDELYHGKVFLTKFGLPKNLEIMGFLNATSCIFRGSMANVLMKITIPFKLEIDAAGTKMSGSYILRNKGTVSEKFGTVNANYKEARSANVGFQWSNGFGLSTECDKKPKSTLLTT